MVRGGEQAVKEGKEKVSSFSYCTHFDEHGTPQLFDINVPCIFPPILISMSQLMSQLSYPCFPKFHMKSHIETKLVDFEGRLDANGLAYLGIMPLGADQKPVGQNLTE